MRPEDKSRPFHVKTLVLAATGSIGVLAVPNYVSLFKQQFAEDVHVLMSKSAQHFVTAEAVALFARNPVLTSAPGRHAVLHCPPVDLARMADLLLVLPATANTIGKAANGIADDPISTTIMACQAPVVFVPSMNDAMWANPVVQANTQILKDSGYHVIPPTAGYSVADMKPSSGAMPGFKAILEVLMRIVEPIQ